jgi:hypothetical protein
MRTARWRTSGANLFVVLLITGPSSHELGPPAIPGRVTSSNLMDVRRLLMRGLQGCAGLLDCAHRLAFNAASIARWSYPQRVLHADF